MENIKELLAVEAAAIGEAIVRDIEAADMELDPLLEEVLRYSLFNGGKRIRPLLVVLSARFCGKDDEGLYKLAIAFEYLHVASLLHDDVIDRAEQRRGKAAVNKKYGLVEAILTGDFLLARAMTLVGQYVGPEGLKIFCDATRAMVDGEFVQLRNNQQYTLSENSYFEVIQGKTAQFISAACEIGALYAKASAEEQKIFQVYGSNLGSAFQIVDDLLDYLGDTNNTGKVVGNDLVEGKVTLPLILSLQNADDKERIELLEILEDGQQRRQCFDRVVRLVENTGGFVQAKARAAGLIQAGVEGLLSVNCKDEGARNILIALAQYVLERNK